MLIFYRRISTDYKRTFFLYSALTTVLIGLAVYFIYIVKERTSYLIVARIHTTIEFTLLSYLFSLIVINKTMKKVIIFSIIPFLILCLSDYLYSKTPSIAYVPLLTECLFFILLIIYFFFEKIKTEVNESLFQTFIFWIAVALLINYSGNFLLFVYSETSNKDLDFKTNYTLIYCTVTIVKNILLCIAVSIKDPLKVNKNSFTGLIPDTDFNDILNTRNPNNIK